MRPARFVSVTPSPAYPPAVAKPDVRSNRTEGNQSRGTPSTPPHRCVIAMSCSAGNSCDQAAMQRLVDAARVLVRRVDARTPVVRRTTSTERDASVGGALGVDQEPAIVVQGLAIVPADLLPEVVGDRFGRDHQGVDRDERATVLRQRCGVALQRPNDHLGADGAARR